MTQDDTHYHYPHATQAARQFADALDGKFDTVSPLTEVATVADTSFQLATGYVQATGRKGPIQVIGVPLNTVCPGMDIFVRQMTKSGISQYVFDGYAPATLNMGTSSGAIVSMKGLGVGATTQALSPASGIVAGGVPITIPTSTAINVTKGWFYSFFFYMAQLPTPGNDACLLSLSWLDANPNASVTYGFNYTHSSIFYDYRGRLTIKVSAGSGVGGVYTTQVFAPHRVWFVTIVAGLGMAVNGISNSGTVIGIENSSGDYRLAPFGTAGANRYYSLNLLSDSQQLANGSPISSEIGYPTPISPCPAGSWISKVTFGYSTDGSGNPVWPYPLGFVPKANTDIITGNATIGQGLSVLTRYLVSDKTVTDLGTGFGPYTYVPDTGTAGANAILPHYGYHNTQYDPNYADGLFIPQGPF